MNLLSSKLFDYYNSYFGFPKENFLMPEDLKSELTEELEKSLQLVANSYISVLIGKKVSLNQSEKNLASTLNKIEKNYLTNSSLFFQETYELLARGVFPALNMLSNCKSYRLPSIANITALASTYKPDNVKFRVFASLYNTPQYLEYNKKFELYSELKESIEKIKKEFNPSANIVNAIECQCNILLLELYNSIKEYILKLEYNNSNINEIRKFHFYLKCTFFQEFA